MKDNRMVRMAMGASILAGALALGGCPKSDEGTKPAPSGASSASAPRPGAADAGPASQGAAPAGKTAAYAGTYALSPGKMYIAETKEFANVKQAKDDPSKHVGEGKLSVSVDEHGIVTGTIESGPASPALIDGTLVAGEIRGNVRRKDPSDDGLTGTLVAKTEGSSAKGELSLAQANAAIVREGKLSLEKK